LADYDKDPLFKFLEKSYARKYLTYVIFTAAIILAILAEYEFIRCHMVKEWTLAVGIIVGIIAVITTILNYYMFNRKQIVGYQVHKKKQIEEEEKKSSVLYIKADRPELSISIEVYEKLTRGSEQKVKITAKDKKSNICIPNAIIRGTIISPSNKKTAELEEGFTDNEGQCSYTLTINKSWEVGTYKVKIRVSANLYDDEPVSKDFKVE
jgi:hypothetical protein